MRRSPDIIRQWVTTEINPVEISSTLHGNLIRSFDPDSIWDIELFYRQRRVPELVLKLYPSRRNIFLAVCANTRGVYLATMKLAGIEDIRFVQYQGKDRIEADMVVNVRDGGFMRQGLILSSKGHVTFR